jgi:RNA polymerase sporulation-specific sigma factor
MNDYELLYLIGERNEDALALMIEKYQPMIVSKCFHFKIRSSERDDFIQEGNLMLLHAIKIFDPSFQKSFTRFFELILTRKFMNLMTPLRKQLIYFSEDLFESMRVEETLTWHLNDAHVSIAKETLTPFEFQIFIEHYQQAISIAQIASTQDVSVKKVYNTLYQIKNKLKLRPDFLDKL